MKILKEIWSFPNTILSYLLQKTIPKNKIIYYADTEPMVVVDKSSLIKNITLGKYAITTEYAFLHELKHIQISKSLGWGYLIHLYYLLYSVILILIHNNSIAAMNLLGAGVFFGLWFWFNEWLVNRETK